MIYGLWRSAAGVMNATYRQGVIANNLANVETVGFKRDLALVQERRLAAQEMPTLARFSDPLFDKIGGGLLSSPTTTDKTQGIPETTNRPYDAAIMGEGYFVVEKDGVQRLTRNGNFMLDERGRLILADGSNGRVLSRDLSPIELNPLAETRFGSQGEVLQYGVPVSQLAIKRADPELLKKLGGHMFGFKDESAEVSALADAERFVVRGGALERSNVDPTVELTAMLQTQRELEANANMIRYQDQALGRLVNDVGRIS